ETPRAARRSDPSRASSRRCRGGYSTAPRSRQASTRGRRGTRRTAGSASGSSSQDPRTLVLRRCDVLDLVRRDAHSHAYAALYRPELQTGSVRLELPVVGRVDPVERILQAYAGVEAVAQVDGGLQDL